VDYDKLFTLQIDASAFALGATLTQVQTDGKDHPVVFFSSSLLPAKVNYDIYN